MASTPDSGTSVTPGITLSINGKQHRPDVSPDTPLLWVLRDELGMTGTKFGCGKAQCGACTVLVDDKAMRSCVLPVSEIADSRITTIEGMSSDIAHAVQQAWIELQVPQCGFCQSGQIISAVALLQSTPVPDDDQINAAMAGNICRCGTYQRIRSAIKLAAGLIK